MTGVRQVVTDYQRELEALRGAAGPLTTQQVAQHTGRSTDASLLALHAATADGVVERLEQDNGRGWRYVWRLRR